MTPAGTCGASHSPRSEAGPGRDVVAVHLQLVGVALD